MRAKIDLILWSLHWQIYDHVIDLGKASICHSASKLAGVATVAKISDNPKEDTRRDPNKLAWTLYSILTKFPLFTLLFGSTFLFIFPTLLFVTESGMFKEWMFSYYE